MFAVSGSQPLTVVVVVEVVTQSALYEYESLAEQTVDSCPPLFQGCPDRREGGDGDSWW